MPQSSMLSSRSIRLFAVLWVLALAAALLALSPGAAHATAKGTVWGGKDDPCVLDWQAASVMNRDLGNEAVTWNGTEYRDLMTGLDGEPIGNYGNGGYLKEINESIRPQGYTGPTGWMEFQHFHNHEVDGSVYTGWRLPVVVDKEVTDAKLTVTLPREMTGVTVWNRTHDYIWQPFAPEDPNTGRPPGQYVPQRYKTYTWESPVAWQGANTNLVRGGTPIYTVSPDGLTYTIPLGTLKEKSAFVIEFDGWTPEPITHTNQFGDAHLTGAVPSCQEPPCDCEPGSSAGSLDLGSLDMGSSAGSLVAGSAIASAGSLGSTGSGSVPGSTGSGSVPGSSGSGSVPGSSGSGSVPGSSGSATSALPLLGSLGLGALAAGSAAEQLPGSAGIPAESLGGLPGSAQPSAGQEGPVQPGTPSGPAPRPGQQSPAQSPGGAQQKSPSGTTGATASPRATGARGALANTGVQIGMAAGAAVLLFAVGTGLVVASRRRRAGE